MIRLLRPSTLFGRTAQALAIAFLLFGLLAAALLQYTLVEPRVKQAADDLAGFLVLVAKIWVELPPGTRHDYQQELFNAHRLRILEAEAAHPTPTNSHAYLHYLSEALGEHVGRMVPIHRHPDYPGWLWADFPMAGRIIRIGFEAHRVQDRPYVILPFLAALGLFIAFGLAVLMVRRITRPLAQMTAAANRIGTGDFGAKLPESGPRELADLARKLNHMDARIQQLIENRTTLLAGISHDLRTPLARMRLELELLHGKADGQMLDALHDDIVEMEKLISQTLMLARGQSGEADTRIDVGALLEAVAADYRRAEQTIRVESAPGCRLEGKAGALRRVVANLVENAVSYGNARPITVSCRRDAAGIEIEVADQGPGIPAGAQRVIFEPFQRIEGSRSKATGGSGLGLAIVDQLCRSNGWQIEVASAPGGGAVFRIRLPGAKGAAGHAHH